MRVEGGGLNGDGTSVPSAIMLDLETSWAYTWAIWLRWALTTVTQWVAQVPKSQCPNPVSPGLCVKS